MRQLTPNLAMPLTKHGLAYFRNTPTVMVIRLSKEKKALRSKSMQKKEDKMKGKEKKEEKIW